MTDFVTDDMRERLLAGVDAAGREVLEVYNRSYQVETKEDDSL